MSSEISMQSWNQTCIVCGSKDLKLVKGTHGDWEIDYECQSCKCVFTFNEGDKMGGQFDTITIKSQ